MADEYEIHKRPAGTARQGVGRLQRLTANPVKDRGSCPTRDGTSRGHGEGWLASSCELRWAAFA